MSIITNALKKAQEKQTQNQEKPSSVGENQKTHHVPATQPKIFPLLLGGVVIFGFIALILLYLTYSSSVTPKATPVQKKEAQKAPIFANINTPEQPSEMIMESAFTGDGAKDLPDLNGIMYAPTLHQAILNGKAVTEGGTVDGFTVLKIYPDSVILSSGDEKIELNLR